jgi:hypothetical protein
LLGNLKKTDPLPPRLKIDPLPCSRELLLVVAPLKNAAKEDCLRVATPSDFLKLEMAGIWTPDDFLRDKLSPDFFILEMIGIWASSSSSESVFVDMPD